MSCLIAGVVIEPKRLDMMPKYFGRWMMQTEIKIYGWLSHICTAYQGGYWDMWEVSNDAFFMVPPAMDEGYRLSIDSNGIIRSCCWCGCLSFCILPRLGNNRR